jgi:phospholipid/cholesterol/gamma-HCH transport system substrate-binding protein
MPRTRSLAWAQLKVGIMAIVAVVLGAFFIMMVGGQGGFSWQRYALKTRFNDIMGLKTGAVVRVAGVEVGTVERIEFVGSEVEVEFAVSKQMRTLITTDSRATIGTLSLLGAAVIDVSPSSTGTPLPNGGTVASRRTPGQLADVADAASKGLQQATGLLADVRAGKGTVGRLFTDDALYRDVNQFISSAEEVVTAISSGRGTLGKLVNDPAVHTSLDRLLSDLTAITSRLNKGEGSLGDLLTDKSFSTSLTAATKNLQELSARLTRGEGTMGKLFTDDALYTRLSALSERLDLLTTRLNAGEGTAGQLLRDKQLYENMNAAVTEMRGLVSDIRRDPKKYLNVKVSLF